MFSKETYIQRRKKLRSLVRSGIVLLPGNMDSAMNYPKNPYRFRQDSSFLYYFGIDRPSLVGIIDIDEGSELIVGNDNSLEDVVWMGEQPSLVDISESVGIRDVVSFKDLANVLCRAAKNGRKIHFLPQYRANNLLLLEQVLGIHPSFVAKYTSVELIRAVVEMRSIKEACEVEEMDSACDIGYEMHTKVMNMAKPGVLEQAICGAIEGVAIANGYMPSFPIILSQDGHILHNHNHCHTLEMGRLLLTDAGAETAMHYASDFTRTIPVGGIFSLEQREVYSIVHKAIEHSIALCKPGATYHSVHIEAAKVIASGLKDLGLMQGDVDEAVQCGAHALFFPHGIGHMLGLDVHDMEALGEDYVGYDDQVSRMDQFGTAYLRLGRKLQPGFTITVEPGIYFIPALIEQWGREKINEHFINYSVLEKYKSFGGIRLEDNVIVTNDGCRLLGSRRIPIAIHEVETFMGR